MSNKKSKKVLFVVAWRGFKDEECFVPLKMLKGSGVDVDIASDKKGPAVGAQGEELNVDYTTEEVEIDDYQGVFFIGGPGALEHLDNEHSYRLARDAIEENKALGAICISPVILAKAGVLKDKKATVWSSSLNKGPVRILENNGARYLNRDVVKDGRIITANGPAAARRFGQKILDLLKKG